MLIHAEVNYQNVNSDPIFFTITIPYLGKYKYVSEFFINENVNLTMYGLLNHDPNYSSDENISQFNPDSFVLYEFINFSKLMQYKDSNGRINCIEL